MKANTTIRQMFAGRIFFVPTNQGAYSWDTEFEETYPPKQVNSFLSDLEDYILKKPNSKFYLGHFVFEKETDRKFAVIEGQQALTTIVIFLSALFSRLKQLRVLEESEQEIVETIIKRNSTYRFETVDYDSQIFKEYVIDQTKKDKIGVAMESAKRIVNAFDFFTKWLSDKDEAYLLGMLEVFEEPYCGRTA